MCTINNQYDNYMQMHLNQLINARKLSAQTINISRTEITFNMCTFGKQYFYDISLTNSSSSSITLDILNDHDHIKLDQNELTVEPKRVGENGATQVLQKRLRIFVQINSVDVQPGVYQIKLIDQENQQVYPVNIVIVGVDFSMFKETEQNIPPASKSFGQHFKKNGFKHKEIQVDNNRFYDAILSDNVVTADPDFIYAEYVKYLKSLRIVSPEQQAEIVSALKLENGLAMKDVWPVFEQVLTAKQKELLTFTIQILKGKSIFNGEMEIASTLGPVILGHGNWGIQLLAVMLQ
ncbi:Hypothetical_protein [Hexamita inflata]|uniref:Hypothetical_protein n=1 Tax=Hexamita inflata TaxID=28002 RepID=A0AA86QY86_9EUKA|nr:Hypothetical protein HINF_LOCUS55926 [Hexamita inflata]